MEVSKSMTIGEVLRQNRDTARIFMEYGMHCLGCPHATSESVEDACATHGADADEMVRKLNTFLSEQQ